MLDLGEQIARVIDDAAVPVTVKEARARARAPKLRGRVAVLVGVAAAIVFAIGLPLVWRSSGTSSSIRVGNTSTTIAPTPIPVGSVVGRLDIEVLGIQRRVFEGDDAEIEAQGPMHDSRTPLPGGNGNSVIVGHRTTHGAPFLRIGELAADSGRHVAITFTAPDGRSYDYTVDRVFTVPSDGTLVPAQLIAQLRDSTDSLTLVTDTPKYSAAERLVVVTHRDRAAEQLNGVHLCTQNGKTCST